MANIPLFIVTGTHFEVGYQIGSTYSGLIHRYYENHPWLAQLEEYYATDAGRCYVDGLWAVAECRFPQYIEELRGLASGSGVDFLQVKLLHLERELTTRLDIYQKTLVDVALGCSDILVNNGTERLIGHNEDWHTALDGTDILLYAHILEWTGSGGATCPSETFLVHMWPGLLPGTTFGVTNHGFVFSIDHLFPEVALENRTPESFLCRHLLTSTCTDDVLAITRDDGAGAALGFSLNFGFVDQSELWNVELAPGSEEACSKQDTHCITPYTDATYAHFNNYKRIMDPALALPLCEEREMTYEAMPTPTDVSSLRTVLGNTSGQFPLYQDVEADLRWATIASVVMDLNRKEMHIFRKNPECHEPVITIPFSIIPLCTEHVGH